MLQRIREQKFSLRRSMSGCTNRGTLGRPIRKATEVVITEADGCAVVHSSHTRLISSLCYYCCVYWFRPSKQYFLSKAMDDVMARCRTSCRDYCSICNEGN